MTEPAPCTAETASGEPCKRPEGVPGSGRCVYHAAGRPGGRPSVLTPELTEQLARMLRVGNYIAVATRAVGIGRATFGDWMRRGESDEPEDALYREFRETMQKALAEGEVRNVATIAAAAAENWQAAAWILERAYPERWGRVSTRLRLPETKPPEEQPGPPVAPGPDDPFAEVDELAERRRVRTS